MRTLVVLAVVMLLGCGDRAARGKFYEEPSDLSEGDMASPRPPEDLAHVTPPDMTEPELPDLVDLSAYYACANKPCSGPNRNACGENQLLACYKGQWCVPWSLPCLQDWHCCQPDTIPIKSIIVCHQGFCCGGLHSYCNVANLCCSNLKCIDGACLP